MLHEQKSIHDMRFDLQDFIAETYDDSLPVYTGDEDVQVLWIAADRMTMFKSMADQSKDEKETRFLMAVYRDYEMLFYGMLYAISAKSDEIARLRHQLAEKNAINNVRNIDSLAGD